MPEVLDEVELQQRIQRFATEFIDRVSQASEGLGASSRRPVREEALRKLLLYGSAVLDIATGPVPSLNLLDMAVFVRLNRTVLEKYWIPTLYRDEGGELLEAFAQLDQEIVALVAHVLTVEQRDQLAQVVATWLSANPKQYRVEGIRLADFSDTAAVPARHLQGLLSGVRTATRAANQAVLLGERALFLVHRIPFLWRLQARVGAREIFRDALAELFTGPWSPRALVKRGAERLTHWRGPFRRLAKGPSGVAH